MEQSISQPNVTGGKPNLLAKPSLLFILFSICFSFWFNDLWKPWHRHSADDHPFVWDVAQYYSYLPATFIYDYDLTFNEYYLKYFNEAPLGGKMPKTTYGMSLLYSPFFALGYKIGINQKSPLTGFSEPFSTCIHFGSVFYGLLGLLFLRNFLVKFYSEKVTTLTLAVVFFGTTLFCYILTFSEMTHGYLFMLFSALLLATYHWYQKPTYLKSTLVGLIIGISCLIRPTEILVSLIFIFWMINSFSGIKNRFTFLLKSYKHLLLMALMVVLLWIPQFLFWKLKTGSYFYFSYPGEQFFWNDPQIINILFSYRKGWFVYTPLALLGFFGLFFMRGEVRRNLPVMITFFLITIYVLSCWWDWNYGGSFGARQFAQYHAFLAIPMASLTQYVFEIKKIRIAYLIQTLYLIIIFSGICLNIGQTHQYNLGLIHYDSMSKKSYEVIFNKYKLSPWESERYWKSLKQPDYDKMRKGKRD